MNMTSREVFNVLHAVRDWTAQEVAERGGVTVRTVRTVNNWRTGRTKFPRFDKLIAVARAAGLRFALVPHEAYVRNEVTAPVKQPRRASTWKEARA